MSLGGIAATLFLLGGITKKPVAVKDKIIPREFLHITLTADHDLIDGGPLARSIETFWRISAF